jgi:hypothetical protein
MTTYANVSSIQVSPGIGLARVGNSAPTSPGDQSYFFLGPETPGFPPNPSDGQYKDASGRIKRQAQRFRVFAYDSGGNLLGEVFQGDTVNGTPVEIQWTVHLANMKSANYCFQGKYGFDPAQLRNSTVQPGLFPAQRNQLIIDPGPQTIQGAGQGPVALLDSAGTGSTIFDVPSGELSGALAFDPPQNAGPGDMVPVTYTPVTVSLGNLYTDGSGRLTVVGGAGEAGSTTTPAVLISKVAPPAGQSPSPNPEYNGNSYFNNPGWYDDTAGGSIDAALVDAANPQTVLFTTQGNPEATGWLAVGPPKYAPACYNVVSLLDLQLDVFPAADPYTGQGPLSLATTGGGGVPTIGASSDLFAITPTAPGGQTTSLAPALTVSQGTVFYALTGEGGEPAIASAPAAGSQAFDFQPASPPGGLTTSFEPALAVFQSQIFYAITGPGGLPAIASSANGAAGSFSFAPLAGAPASEAGPALAAFNGQLYCAMTGTAGQHLLGSSAEGLDGYAFQPVDGGTATSSSRPALASFQGSLYYAFTGGDGQPYLASSGNPSDATSFQFVSIGSSLQSSVGPALATFNGQLYYALLAADGMVELGVSSDGQTFTFSALSGNFLDGVALAVNEPVNFYRDVLPILRLVTDYAWINQLAFTGHQPGSQGDFLRGPFLSLLADPSANGATARSFVFNFIRPPAQPTPLVLPPPAPVTTSDVPDGGIQNGALMPRLFGTGGSPTENEINETNFPNQWLSLTNLQLSKFQRWVNGDFSATPAQPRWQDLPQPQSLDFAALQPTVGGGFHPGIELTYLMAEPSFFAAPFRFAADTVPGSIAAYMSVPWHGDFWSCNTSWWPPARPDIVVQTDSSVAPPLLTSLPWFRGNLIPPGSDVLSSYEAGYQTMAENWQRFGFVIPLLGFTDQGEQIYQEMERDPTLDAPSVLASVVDDSPGGNVLAGLNSSVFVEKPEGQGYQQWFLQPYSASPAYFFVANAAGGGVLTAVDPPGSPITLAPQASPADDSQLWSYVPTGYPGVFLLESKLNSGVLTVDSNSKAVTQPQTTGATQEWQLQAPA